MLGEATERIMSYLTGSWFPRVKVAEGVPTGEENDLVAAGSATCSYLPLSRCGGGSVNSVPGSGGDEGNDGDVMRAKSHDVVAQRHRASNKIYRQPPHPRNNFLLHLGFPLFLLIVLSAQPCSSEVIRLRHPDHLYYGDRGGGGGGEGNPIIHHRNINDNHHDDFLMEVRDASANHDDDDEREQETQNLLQPPHHRSSHPSAISHKVKKSSPVNDSSSSSSSNFSESDSTYGVRHVPHRQLHHFHHPQQQQQQQPHHAAIAEDRELPVYFAKQGNDGGQDVDRPADPAVESDKEKEAPPAEEDGKLFPPDLFTLEQRRKGAVVFYILGVIYMFVALAIVCDEFFVPSLDVIIEFLQIQDDVAGATFMAAGGSAPELFTSVIGVFISKDDVGIGTIVGSAVFNILFVIGMCALFSKTVLRLTWWPLFRDCSFYSVALITLICFFQDSYIYWWEALILFSIYICYVTFMKFNQTFERAIKKLLFKNRVTRVSSTDQLVNNKSVNNGASSSQTSVQTVSGNQSSRGSATLKPPLSAQGRRNSIPMLHSGSKFRHGLLQLMIQSIDPLHDGRVDEKATQLHAIASLKALLDAAKTEADATVTTNSRSKPVSPPQVPASVQPSDAPLTTVDIEEQANGDAPTAMELAALQEAEVEGHEPLDISWPKGDCKKQISYVVLFPIMILLYLTLPDTRTPRGKKFFAWGFLGSILWIAVFSYFMVWWADRTGETFGIAPEIMGLTFLAAGTSIPDLITSVIVARKGLGDMAVSSSVGSNIFDVCVGLPVPWLLYGIFKGEPVEVSAKGMLCSIAILFGMLCFVVISIMVFRWKMNKGLGLVMFVLYFIFLGVSLLFEYQVITCPRFFEQ